MKHTKFFSQLRRPHSRVPNPTIIVLRHYFGIRMPHKQELINALTAEINFLSNENSSVRLAISCICPPASKSESKSPESTVSSRPSPAWFRKPKYSSLEATPHLGESKLIFWTFGFFLNKCLKSVKSRMLLFSMFRFNLCLRREGLKPCWFGSGSM